MKAIAALALAVVAISWAAILIRLCSAPPLIISFYRLGIAAAFLLPFALSRSQLGWWRGRAATGPAVVAGIFLGLHFASWVTSLHLTTVASSVVLVTTTPVFAALFSAKILGERAGRTAWAGIALSVAGSAIIAWGDYRQGSAGGGAGGGLTGTMLVGDLLALAGAVLAAAYFTIGRRVRERAPLTGYLTLVYATGAATVMVGAVARGDRFAGYPPREYVLFVALALVPNLIGHSLLNWSVRRMRTYVVNVAILGEAVLATIYAVVLFGEVPGLFWAAGSALIVGGVMAVFLSERGQVLPPSTNVSTGPSPSAG